VVIDGGFYHVSNLSNARANIFLMAVDVEAFLRVVVDQPQSRYPVNPHPSGHADGAGS